jgi:hypothetical protein
LSTPIEDPILLKSSELYSILFDKYEVSMILCCLGSC